MTQENNNASRDWLLTPLAVFAVIFAMVLALGSWTGSSMPEGYNLNAGYDAEWKLNGFWSWWLRWDSEWYVEVAEDGYDYIPDTGSEIGYFPVYPHLMRWLSPITGNALAAGMLISVVCTLVSLVLLYRLTLQEIMGVARYAPTNAKGELSDNAQGIARRTVLYLMLYPAAFFLFMAYTEALFLLLSLLAAWFAREKRWLWASIIGIVASATRIQGVFVIVLVGVEWLNHHGWSLRRITQTDNWQKVVQGLREDWQNAVFIALIPSGLIAFMVFQWMTFGTPFAFIDSHSTIASDVGRIPFVSVIWQEVTWTLRGDNPDPWIVPLGIAALVLSCIALPTIFKRLRESYFLYTLALILLPAWVGPIYSMTRFVVVMFPVFMVLAIWGTANKWVHLVYLTISPILLILATIFHVRWLFVA